MADYGDIKRLIKETAKSGLLWWQTSKRIGFECKEIEEIALSMFDNIQYLIDISYDNLPQSKANDIYDWYINDVVMKMDPKLRDKIEELQSEDQDEDDTDKEELEAPSAIKDLLSDDEDMQESDYDPFDDDEDEEDED
jgi:hypothetical protein